MEPDHKKFEEALHELVRSENARDEAQSYPERFATSRGLTEEQMQILGNDGVAKHLGWPECKSASAYCGCCCIHFSSS